MLVLQVYDQQLQATSRALQRHEERRPDPMADLRWGQKYWEIVAVKLFPTPR
jgi:hypothetical protein